jgi:hypothetical protein
MDGMPLVESVEADDFVFQRISQNLKESLDSSNIYGSIQEQLYIKEMQGINEDVLIRKGFYKFTLPMLILGFLGYWFPYIYALLPSHFVQMCTCMFFCRDYNYAIFDKTDEKGSYESVLFINAFSMSLISVMIYSILLTMIHRIRNIEDETFIKRECAAIAFLWCVMSFIAQCCFYV